MERPQRPESGISADRVSSQQRAHHSHLGANIAHLQGNPCDGCKHFASIVAHTCPMHSYAVTAVLADAELFARQPAQLQAVAPLPRGIAQPTDPEIGVVVVDDDPGVLVLMRETFGLDGTFRLVGEARDGAQAVALVARCRPQLVLLDVDMPGMDGIEALGRILANAPSTRVVMHSGSIDDELAQTAIRLGACGYIKKGAASSDMIAVLRTACSMTRADNGNSH
jgi:CheY-like chemotaxis protein